MQPVNITRTMADYFANPPRSLDGREVEYDLVLENVGFDGKDVKWVSLEVESSTLDQWYAVSVPTCASVLDVLDLTQSWRIAQVDAA